MLAHMPVCDKMDSVRVFLSELANVPVCSSGMTSGSLAEPEDIRAGDMTERRTVLCNLLVSRGENPSVTEPAEPVSGRISCTYLDTLHLYYSNLRVCHILQHSMERGFIGFESLQVAHQAGRQQY